jgi:hypothetical protein
MHQTDSRNKQIIHTAREALVKHDQNALYTNDHTSLHCMADSHTISLSFKAWHCNHPVEAVECKTTSWQQYEKISERSTQRKATAQPSARAATRSEHIGWEMSTDRRVDFE